MATSTPARAADRNLLFGILALQMDFIGRDALIQAMHAWVLDKSKPLGQILMRQGSLTEDEHALLTALVQKHLEKHGNDPERSLAAVTSVGSVRAELEQIADADLHATLDHVSVAVADEPDREPANSSSVGAPTVAGLCFRILRPHARGGLGEVFVALDEELHREVALKEIQERHAHHPESRSRFVLEAEITGGLEHPGIVPVYGLGQYADGRPFYAMRFIKGDSLKDAIAHFHHADVTGRDPGERTLALRQLLGRFTDVCNALAYAHSRGVLHRDLKPGNIMLGKYGETLVVDWGLAKPVGRREESQGTEEATLRPASAGGSAETLAGSALGTPAFMSPEQAAGKLDLLGPASDVYSLGATLYCLLTGKTPFEGDDVGVTLQRVQRGEFPAPREVKPGVPPGLEAICLKAMALRPVERYGSTRALADDVEHWLADEPVSALPEPWTVRARRWLGRHHSLVTATAAALVVAIVSLTVATVLLTAANEGERMAKDYAQGKEREATKQRDKADAQLLRAEWLVYAGKISLAQREWEANNVGVARDLLDSCRWDLRGWEHDYLHTLFNSNQKTFYGHTHWVTSVAFSPDGKRLVSGSWDDTVKVWDATSSQDILTLQRHTRGVFCVAFNPDGKRLASGNGDSTVNVWDAMTGQDILTLKGHTGPVRSVAFSPDGKRLASGSDDKTVKVWDATTGQNTLILWHTSFVTSVAFSSDGKRLVSGSYRTVKVWDAMTGQNTLTLKGHNCFVTSVAFSPDGKRLASGSEPPNDPGEVKVWDATTGQNTLTLKGHNGYVRSVAFSPDGKRLVSGGGPLFMPGEAKVWDATTGQDTLTLKGHAGPVTSVAFSPDGKRLVSGSYDGTVKVWDAHSKAPFPANAAPHAP